MKRLVILLVAIVSVVSCGPKSARTETGKFFPYEDGYGFVLPVCNNPGEKQDDYSIIVTFEDTQVFLKSRKELADPFLSIMYRNDSGPSDHETTQVSLDFVGHQNGNYIYATSYSWFIPKSLASKVMMAGFYYAPYDVAIPTIKKEGPDGEDVLFPDYTGYCFLFNENEFQVYFKEFISHLN